MLTQRRRLSGKSAVGKATHYALNRREALARYLEDGGLSIDTDVFDKPERVPPFSAFASPDSACSALRSATRT
jgi:hypothetical protein